jgi:LysR family glycine cleavage system transcriptional activator
MPARRLPPLRALEAFMRTVRLGSARAAAEDIGLSPSALSRRISNLEEFVGKKLFTRARQSMQLTDEGQAFYEAVNPHMEALARAVESQSDNIALLRLRLGVLPMFGSQRLFPRLGELRKRHPLLHIDIDTAPHLEDRVGDTLDHNLVHAICAKETARGIGLDITPEAMSKQTFLIHNELPESFVAWKKANGLEQMDPAAIDHYNSGALMLEAAAQGLGIAIMHDDHLRRASDNRLINLPGVPVESPYSYWFVCKPVALESRPVRIFHDWLVRAGL